MRRNLTVWSALILCAAAGTGVHAQGQGVVDVQLAPAVQARAAELGPQALRDQQQYLRQSVARALARSHDRPASVRLVIEDLQPNRPTGAELGRSPALSQGGSFGLGGAAVDGEVTMGDGRSLPVRYRFFPANLQVETNFTTWGDADQAFDDVAQAIGSGHPPDQRGAWPPPHPPSIPTGTRLPS